MILLKRFSEEDSAVLRRNMKMVSDWIDNEILPRLRSKVVVYIDSDRTIYLEINPFYGPRSKITRPSPALIFALAQAEFKYIGDGREYDSIAYEVLAQWPTIRNTLLMEVKEQNDIEWLNTFSVC